VSAGPYFLRDHVEGRTALAVRNPYWNGGAIPRRPAGVEAIAIGFGYSAGEAQAMVEGGEADLVVPTSAALPALRTRFGVNEDRLFVRPGLAISYLAFNHERPLFRDNLALRRAVNFAADRAGIARQGAPGRVCCTDQILPPAMPGHAAASLYPLDGADVERARRLARGAERGARATVFAANSPAGPGIAAVVKASLAQIGLEADVHVFDFPVFAERTGRGGEPWDIAVCGWTVDYLDPANLIEALLHGRNIHAERSLNIARFDDPAWNRRIDSASALTGEARYAAFGALDRELMRDAAPIAPLVVENSVVFTSARLAGFTFHALGFVDLVAASVVSPSLRAARSR
jgi:ABC-type transport system substrate-binding protein